MHAHCAVHAAYMKCQSVLVTCVRKTSCTEVYVQQCTIVTHCTSLVQSDAKLQAVNWDVRSIVHWLYGKRLIWPSTRQIDAGISTWFSENSTIFKCPVEYLIFWSIVKQMQRKFHDNERYQRMTPAVNLNCMFSTCQGLLYRERLFFFLCFF